MENWWEWQNRIQASHGYRVELELHQLDITLKVLLKNHADLFGAIQRYRDPGFASRLWPKEKWDFAELDDFLFDVTRMLHNYVGAAMTLVDHTRIWVARYEGTDFYARYESRKNADFAEAPLHNFIKGLRNFILHVGLPSIIGKAPDYDLVLDGPELLASGDFKNKAKEYLASQEARFRLGPVIDEYTERVKIFRAWLEGEVRQHHKTELAELAELRVKFKAWREEQNS